MAADAGELQRELIVRVEPPPPALVAAEQRVGAGADDEFVAGIIAAGGENRVVHGGKDFALVRAGVSRIERRRGPRDRRVSPPRARRRVPQAIFEAQARNEIGDIGEFAARQRSFEAAAVEVGQPLRVELDAEPPPGAEIVEHRA